MSCVRTPLARLAFAVLALLVGCFAYRPAIAATPLVLEVSVDGEARDEPLVGERRDGHLWLDVRDLPALAGVDGGAGGKIDLNEVAGLTYRLDEASQSLAITLPSSPPSPRRRAAVVREREDTTTPNGWGSYLNYDVVGTTVAGRAALDGALDLRVFAPRASAFGTMLVHAGATTVLQKTLTRLETGVSVPDLRHDRRWTFGDFITGGTTSSRSFRMGGIQLGTDFGLRPDLVTFPVPEFGDQAGVPSTTDLVAGSVARTRSAAPAGAFSTATAPVTTGLNTINVVARDRFGRESTRTLSFYATRSLLAPGLSAISLEAGFVRTGYGAYDDRYRRAAAVGSYRRGLSSTLTVEAHGEVTRGVATIGGGATIGLARLGAVYLAAAASRGRVFERSGGSQVAVGWERVAHPLSVSAQYVRTASGYADVAARYATPLRRDTLIVNISFDLGRVGRLSGAYLRLSRGQARFDDARRYRASGFAVYSAGSSRRLDPLSLASATYALPIARRFSFVASATRAIGEQKSFSASAGLLISFGARTSAQASIETREAGVSGRVAVARPAIAPGDIGVRADLSAGILDRQGIAAEHVGTRGRIQAAIERAGGTVAARASAQGALVLTGQGLFAADRIDRSFAVVDTGGNAAVPIFRENRPVGMTDRRGFLVVTGLLPYQSNKLSLDADALDADAVLPTAERAVRPRDGSGVRVDFGIRRSTGIVARLVDEAGRPIPAGSRASLPGQDPVPVGMDGEAYFTDVPRTGQLRAVLADGRRCAATPHSPNAMPIHAATILMPCRFYRIAERTEPVPAPK